MREALLLDGPLDLDAILAIPPPARPRWRHVWRLKIHEGAGLGGRHSTPHGALYVPAASRVPDYLDDLVAFAARADLTPIVQGGPSPQLSSRPSIPSSMAAQGASYHKMLGRRGILSHATLPLSARASPQRGQPWMPSRAATGRPAGRYRAAGRNPGVCRERGRAHGQAHGRDICFLVRAHWRATRRASIGCRSSWAGAAGGERELWQMVWATTADPDAGESCLRLQDAAAPGQPPAWRFLPVWQRSSTCSSPSPTPRSARRLLAGE